MPKLGLILALAALALGAYGLLQLGEKDQQIDDLRTANQELQDRLGTLEAQLGVDQPGEAGMRFVDGEDADAVADGTASGAAGGLKGRGGTPMSRLAALEKQVASQNKLIADMKAKGSSASAPMAPSRVFNRGNFYGNLDMASKQLELEKRQKEDMQDIIDRAQQELKDLYAIENDEGVTWNEVRKPKMVEGSGFSFAMPDMKKISAFKKGRIPGSSETFGEAEKRIRKDAFGRMRNVLTPKQQEKWDKAHKDAMLRGGRGGMVSSISFVGMESDD